MCWRCIVVGVVGEVDVIVVGVIVLMAVVVDVMKDRIAVDDVRLSLPGRQSHFHS
jgi:hypothetical protein